MSPSLSIYFELARFIATAMVFLGHGKIFYQPVAALCETTNPGRDAVLIFFVLSGYVITWCARERDHDLREFAVNRAARIYSVAIPALALGMAVSALISAVQSQALDYPLHKPWLYLPIYLSFTGRFWSLHEVPPANFPYWSLNYEVWYYVLFGILAFVRGTRRWWLAAAVMLAIGPAVLSLWPLWLAGSLLHEGRHRLRCSERLAAALIALSLAGYFIVKATGLDNTLDALAAPVLARWVDPRVGKEMAGDYLIGTLVVLNFLGAMNLQIDWRPGTRKVLRALAGGSFSLYLFHMPLFEAIELVWTSDDSLPAYLAIMLGTGALIYLLAEVTEKRKGLYRATIDRALDTAGHALALAGRRRP